MINPERMSLALLVGLLFRRKKWHAAEYNRIVATQDGGTPAVRDAMVLHQGAMAEIDALMARQEADWGGERDITETFLNWEHPGSQEPGIQAQDEAANTDQRPGELWHQEGGDPGGHGRISR